MTELPKILAQEEEDMAAGCRNHPDILVSIHNNAGKFFFLPCTVKIFSINILILDEFSVQTRALGHITDVITRPLVQTLYDRLKLNKERAEFLKQQVCDLKKQLGRQ